MNRKAVAKQLVRLAKQLLADPEELDDDAIAQAFKYLGSLQDPDRKLPGDHVIDALKQDATDFLMEHTHGSNYGDPAFAPARKAVEQIVDKGVQDLLKLREERQTKKVR